MREIIIPLVANQSHDVAARGRYLRVKSSSASIKIEIDAPSVSANLVNGQGFKLDNGEFKIFRVINGATPQIVTLIVGDGEFIDPIGGGGVVNTLSTQVSPANIYIERLPSNDITVGQTIAARAGRKSITLMAAPENVLDIWISHNNSMGNDSRLRLSPGQSISFDTSAAIVYKLLQAGDFLSYVETY